MQALSLASKRSFSLKYITLYANLAVYISVFVHHFDHHQVQGK